jgi:hypothetical protein
MERKVIQGQEYVIEYVKVQTENVPIVGVVSEHNPNFVQFESKRPNHLNPPQGVFTYFTAINEYFDDFRFIYKSIDQNGMTDGNINKAFLSLCNKHITIVGRLIDTDLFTYIDQIIMARHTLIEKFHGQEMNHNECQEMWTTLKNLAFDKYKDNIYLSKYDFSDPTQPKPSLVKLSDIL